MIESGLCVLSCITSPYSFLGAKTKRRKVQYARDDDEIVSNEEVIPPPKSKRQLSQEAKATQKAAKQAKFLTTKLDKWTKHDYITMRNKNPYE
jgi:malic enzyme